MNRVMRSTVVLAAALGALSCKGDPTDSLRNGIDHLVASPSVLFIGPDSTQSVVIEAVDDQGNRLSATFAFVSATAGLTVAADDSFNLVYNDKGVLAPPKNWTRARFDVTTVNPSGLESVVFSGGGKQITVPVRILASSAPSVTLSTAAANAGDTVIATAPANFRFTPASVVTGTGGVIAGAGISADSSQLSFIVGPNLNGAVTVNNLVLQYAPTAAAYSTSATGTLTTGAAPDLTVTPASAAAGDTITVTVSGVYRFTPTSVPSFGAAGFALVGISADSLTLRFVVGPSANAPVSVTKIQVAGTPSLGNFTLTSGAVILTTPPVTSFPGTFSNSTPALNDTVTVTAGAGFKFLPTATISFGGRPGVVITRAADSNSISLVPLPGTGTSVASATGIVLSFLTTVSLNIPSVATLAAPSGLAGTGAFGTAPTLIVPAIGSSNIQVDAGSYANDPTCTGDLGGPCRIYKIVLAAPATISMTLRWQGTTDLGMYLYDATASFDGTLVCDALGAGAGGQPETCSALVPAGTWYFVVDSFAPFYAPPNNVDPTDLRIDLVVS